MPAATLTMQPSPPQASVPSDRPVRNTTDISVSPSRTADTAPVHLFPSTSITARPLLSTSNNCLPAHSSNNAVEPSSTCDGQTNKSVTITNGNGDEQQRNNQLDQPKQDKSISNSTPKLISLVESIKSKSSSHRPFIHSLSLPIVTNNTSCTDTSNSSTRSSLTGNQATSPTSSQFLLPSRIAALSSNLILCKNRWKQLTKGLRARGAHSWLNQQSKSCIEALQSHHHCTQLSPLSSLNSISTTTSGEDSSTLSTTADERPADQKETTSQRQSLSSDKKAKPSKESVSDELPIIDKKKSNQLRSTTKRLSSEELREQNLARTLKSVDCKDLTLMQILALKSLEFTVPATALVTKNGATAAAAATAGGGGGCRLSAPPFSKSGGSTTRTELNSTTAIDGDHNCVTYERGGDESSVNKVECMSPNQWVQLAGHQQAFTSAPVAGRIWKRNDRNELRVYERLFAMQEPITRFMPRFYRVVRPTDSSGQQFIELQDLLQQFNNPRLMDIKMGCRTFLEEEVQNRCARPDLYEKLIKIDPSAATTEEHSIKAVTKLRYMVFRENMSSSSTLGFRIEAFRCGCGEIINDFKYLRRREDVRRVLQIFLPAEDRLRQQLVDQLKELKRLFESSQFFRQHELIGSSLLIIHDANKVGVWMIDFAKTLPLSTIDTNETVNHRKDWVIGNHEDGYLTGLDNLTDLIQDLV